MGSTPLTPKRKAIAVASVVVSLVCLVIIITNLFSDPPARPKRKRRKIEKIWYFDSGDEKLFAVDPKDPNNLPPIEGPSGKNAFRAYVFACGDCEDKSKQFIGYLEAYTPEARALQLEIDAKEAAGQEVEFTSALLDTIDQGHIARVPGQEKWLSINSDEGDAMISAAASGSKCPKGVAIKSCYP